MAEVLLLQGTSTEEMYLHSRETNGPCSAAGILFDQFHHFLSTALVFGLALDTCRTGSLDCLWTVTSAWSEHCKIMAMLKGWALSIPNFIVSLACVAKRVAQAVRVISRWEKGVSDLSIFFQSSVSIAKIEMPNSWISKREIPRFVKSQLILLTD